MDQRLKDLADTVAEVLARRWLEQEQRTADQHRKSGTNPKHQPSADKRRLQGRTAGNRKRYG